MIEIGCLSVPGGWQTCVLGTTITFGPVFNRVNDLWDWQRQTGLFVKKAA